MPDIDVMPTDLEVLVAPRVRLPNSPDAHSMLVRMISIASSAMLLAWCHEGVLDPHGPIGKAETKLEPDESRDINMTASINIHHGASR
jgi:hypothetical protein